MYSFEPMHIIFPLTICIYYFSVCTVNYYFSIKNWMRHSKDDIVDLFRLFLKIVIFSLCLSLIIRWIDV